MTDKRKIYIRADGNGEIGMGHVMRCLSIAAAVREEGGSVCFLLAGHDAREAVEKEGFACVVLGTDYRRMEDELPVLEKILRQSEAESCVFLVDSYFVTEEYLRALRKWGKVAYMDDMDAFPYPVDAIINGNVYGAEMDYSACEADTQIWGGLAFAPLRSGFEVHRGKRREDYILVTTGSSDPYHLAEKIVGFLLRQTWTEHENICVVCGRFSQSFSALQAMGKQDRRLRILHDVPDMWNVMNGAKFAITAAGSTMQELCCMGVPIIGFSFADNQKKAVFMYAERGYSHYGGDYLALGESMIGEICRAAEQLCTDPSLRGRYSSKIMNLVDGEGSYRIAEKLISL
ncbi:MAG: UDP-2,4-diacetamido-2,4,6-trideoxy-beta-L-altropyranose hydrolase [Lachnospiraceae bacterium]|nr:UDP-2,4-diacetamido-2,4,6-trideoxy-beta-L-altropyranose hydrolase [Lachnospiraceae bacterium]